jgi:hypothetical protein
MNSPEAITTYGVSSGSAFGGAGINQFFGSAVYASGAPATVPSLSPAANSGLYAWTFVLLAWSTT